MHTFCATKLTKEYSLIILFSFFIPINNIKVLISTNLKESTHNFSFKSYIIYLVLIKTIVIETPTKFI